MGVIKRCDLAWIAVSDLKAARAFFTGLGFKERVVSEEYGWAELEGPQGGATLGLAHKSASSPIQPGHNGVMTFTVDDLLQAKKELQKKGVKMLGDVMEVPGHVKIQMFQDPDGNHFQLVEILE